MSGICAVLWRALAARTADLIADEQNERYRGIYFKALDALALLCPKGAAPGC